MKKATAVAPANIAFIKYWGKRDEALRLPLNASISMNLSKAFTTTTVEFSSRYETDSIKFLSTEKLTKTKRSLDFGWSEKNRIIGHLNRLRTKANISDHAKIVTDNSFPKSAGIASSASGFAALTVAAAAALELTLSEKELSILARLGSGSACRSIPDGFVEWVAGNSSNSSYARSLYPSGYWDIYDVIAIVSREEKKVSTSEGMEAVRTSPFWKERSLSVIRRLNNLKKALGSKNFSDFGLILESECINMHAVMMTQNPALIYWNDGTVRVMQKVVSLRREGMSVYFTIDAGPTVHVICEGKNVSNVEEAIRKISGVEAVVTNKPAQGAHTISEHLF